GMESAGTTPAREVRRKNAAGCVGRFLVQDERRGENRRNPSRRDQTAQRSRSPRMNCSTQRYASSSVICTGGCLEKKADAECNTPPIPRSSASLQQRIASIATPAELGESSTESLISISIATSPKSRPSARIKAILLSSCQGT